MLRQISRQENEGTLEILKIRLESLKTINSSRQTISNHLNNWKNILSIWQWGNYASKQQLENYSQLEIKAIEEFLSCLEEAQSIKLIASKVSYTSAINYLEGLIKQSTCQIASDRSNVQILGLLEAVGLTFDHIIMIGFNSENWPQKNKINPFIPIELQRSLNMPGSSAEREYQYAKSLSSTLLSSATEICVTASLENSSNSNCHSSFFASLPLGDLRKTDSNLDSLELNSNYQWIEDDSIDLVKERIRGGSYLLNDYSKCPFMALAKHQFNISDYQIESKGIDAITRGSWLHSAMEFVWQQLKNQKALLSKSEEELNCLVESSVAKACRNLEFAKSSKFEEVLIELESKKLVIKILEWLAIEKQRDDFETYQLEQGYGLNIGQIDLNFRIDRIDKNANGALDIIDYKTGKTTIANWFGVRPTEAQMPAYLLSQGDKAISSLSYGQIKVGEISRKGIKFQDDKSDQKILPIGIKRLPKGIENYTQQISDWRTTLERLSCGISRGYMPVSPKDGQNPCQYCEYQRFCRIEEESIGE